MKSASVVAITNWTTALLAAGHIIYVPEVVDYEVRRELIRAGKLQSVQELDAQKSRFQYKEITTKAMFLAADLWARMRNSILAAQAIAEGQRLNLAPSRIIIATSNVAHLSRMVSADLWQNIAP